MTSNTGNKKALVDKYSQTVTPHRFYVHMMIQDRRRMVSISQLFLHLSMPLSINSGRIEMIWKM